MRKIWLILSAAIISALISIGITRSESEMQLEMCIDLIVPNDGYIYGIDYKTDKQKYYIYRCTEAADNAYVLIKPSDRHKRRYEYDEMIYDKKEKKVYVHVSEYSYYTGFLEKEEVFLCDFEKHRLKPVWEISPKDEEQVYTVAEACMIQDGVLYYVKSGDTEDIVYRQTDSDAVEVRRIRNYKDVQLTEYHFFEKGELMAFCTDYGLFRENSGEWEICFGNTEGCGSFAKIVWGENKAAFWDLFKEHMVSYLPEEKVTLKGEPEKTLEIQAILNDDEENKFTITVDMLNCLCLLPDGGFAANTELPKFLRNNDSNFQSGLAISRNGTVNIYRNISYNNSYLIHMGILNFSITGLIFSVITAIILVGYSFYSKKKYIPIQIEITFFSVIFFGTAIGFTAYEINNLLRASFDNSYREIFEELEKEITAELDLIVQQTGITGYNYYNKDFRDKLGDFMSDEIIDNPVMERKEFAPYYILHLQDNQGKLIVAFSSSGNNSIPTSYVYNNYYVEEYYESVLYENKGRNLTQVDMEGIWNVRLCPYVSLNGNIKGVIEIGIEQYLSDYKSERATLHIVIFMVVSCAVMVIAIIIFLGISFSSLKLLGKQVGSGKITKPENSRYSRETVSIWEQLYVMLENVRQNQEKIEQNNFQHYRFISAELVKLLGANALEGALPEMHRRCVLHFVCAAFPATCNREYQQYYSEILSAAEAYGAIVLKIKPESILWLFSGGINMPIDAANEIRKISEQNGILCGIGVGSSEAILYVRGTEEHADIAVDSDEAEQVYKLAFKAVNTKEKILLTTNVEKQFTGQV